MNAALYPNSVMGSTTNSVCLSADEKTLYIANADNNCLAVFDVTKPGNSHSKGFIPCGWYPTCVRVIGKKKYVSNGKGFSSMANPFGPNPMKGGEKISYHKGDTAQTVQYIGGLFKGTLSIIAEPSAKQLSIYSQAVYKNRRYIKANELKASGEAGNPVPEKVGGPSSIKYVFYIIRKQNLRPGVR